MNTTKRTDTTHHIFHTSAHTHTKGHKELHYLFHVLLESENCVIARKFNDISSKIVLTSQTKDH